MFLKIAVHQNDRPLCRGGNFEFPRILQGIVSIRIQTLSSSSCPKRRRSAADVPHRLRVLPNDLEFVASEGAIESERE